VSAIPSPLAWLIAFVLMVAACRCIRAVFDAYDRAVDQRETFIERTPDRSVHRAGSQHDFNATLQRSRWP